MDILVIGSGGREYSIGLALSKDKNVDKIYFAPGNGATCRLGENISIKDFEKLAEFVKEKNIELTIVGPEAPLVDGIVDVFKSHNLNVFGSSKAASQLEGSKIFMKNFLARNNIPTAAYIETSNIEKANEFIDSLTAPIVVKADGLCAGKGVIIATSKEEAKEAAKDMLSGESFGDAGTSIVVEEFLDGYELSVFAICDGEDYKILPAAQDHKRLLDGDKGPNTGGMGAYAPTPLINDELYRKINERVVDPTNLKIELSDKYAVCVVMASENYPYKSSKPAEIIVDDSVDEDVAKHTHISYAGVTLEDEKLYATGGRVLLCVGLGNSIKEARNRAYARCGDIHFVGKKFRTDIAYQALK